MFTQKDVLSDVLSMSKYFTYSILFILHFLLIFLPAFLLSVIEVEHGNLLFAILSFTLSVFEP